MLRREGGGKEPVQRALLHRVPGHRIPVAAEGIQRLLKPLIGKRLHQIVHHPQLEQGVHSGGVVGGGDHDSVDTNPLAPEGVEQLQPGEEWHIDIQHRQIGGVLLQPGQGGPAVLKGLHHLEAGVPLHKGAVQEGDHGVVLHNDNTVHSGFLLGGREGFPAEAEKK